jgi:hypothetical protein
MSPRIDCSIVPDQKRGERIRTMQTFQKIEDHFTGPEVEIAGRLVGQQDGGCSHQSSAQHNTLSLRAG